MPAAFFFASYAHLDNNKFAKLSDVFEELRERVRGKVGAAQAERVGFLDLEGVQTGAEWVNRLGEVVAQCRVFVCFCSNTYFNREVCGREFEAFRRRLNAPGAPAGAFLFPIIWDKCRMPAAVQPFSADHIDLPREYFEDGLCTLQRVRRATEYETAIEALATAIAQAVNGKKLPLGEHPIDFDSLPSAFDNPGEDTVRVAALCDEGLLWEPEIGFTARAAVEAATAPDRIRWRQFSCGVVPATTLAATSPGDEPTILIVPDPSAAWRPRLADLDTALASGATAPCAVLLGVGAPGPQGVTASAQEAALLQNFPKSLRQLPHSAVFDEQAPATLTDRLREAIYRLRARTLTEVPVARVTDPQLEEAARNGGVPIDTRPTLSGPGGRS